MTTIVQTVIAQAEALGGDLNRPSAYKRAVGQAVGGLLSAKRINRNDLGLRVGVPTLIIGGHDAGIVTPEDWYVILEACGAKGAREVYADFYGAFSRLLGDLVLLRGFDLGDDRFEAVLESVGLEWRSLATEVYNWGKGQVPSAEGLALLKKFGIDWYKEENGDAFCDLLGDYKRFSSNEDDDDDLD